MLSLTWPAVFLASIFTIIACENPDNRDTTETTTGKEDTMKLSPHIMSLVLKKPRRNAKSIDEVVELLNELNIPITGKGTATLSIRVDTEVLEQVFHVPANKQDDITVPEFLSPYVQLISIEPPHEKLNE